MAKRPVAMPWPECLLLRVQHQPPSPCNSVCRIDPDSGYCLGCKRTLDEIADWPILTPAEKRALLRELEARPASR